MLKGRKIIFVFKLILYTLVGVTYKKIALVDMPYAQCCELRNVRGPDCNASITKTRPCNIQKFSSSVKNENLDFFFIFLIFAQNIDCGNTWNRLGCSNEYDGTFEIRCS